MYEFIIIIIIMKHLVLITFMKVEEVINYFYAHVLKNHDLLKFFMFDWDTQFIFDVWKHICKIKLIIKLNFKLTFWTWIEIELNCSHFQLNLSQVAHIFNFMWLNSTENWVNSTQLIKNSSLMSRKLNIENFSIFYF